MYVGLRSCSQPRELWFFSCTMYMYNVYIYTCTCNIVYTLYMYMYIVYTYVYVHVYVNCTCTCTMSTLCKLYMCTHHFGPLHDCTSKLYMQDINIPKNAHVYNVHMMYNVHVHVHVHGHVKVHCRSTQCTCTCITLCIYKIMYMYMCMRIVMSLPHKPFSAFSCEREWPAPLCTLQRTHHH